MLTEQIARWAAAVPAQELPEQVTAQVRRLMLDYVGGVVAASRFPTPELVASYAGVAYPGTEATALGFGRLSAEGAALVNGTAAHSLEVDDGYTPGSVHPSAVVFSAVLPAAQRHGSLPEQVVAAAAVGLELVCRLAAAGHPATWRNGFHNTPLAGVMGAAAAVSILLGLDAAGVEHALGVAGSHAGGLFAFLGQDAEIKRVHPGKAARDGLASAELAARGLTGPTGVLEGTKGYFDAFTRGDYSPETLTKDLGSEWAMLRTYVKPYPCCRHLHGPIDAALQLRRIPSEEIEAITVDTYTVASHHAATAVDSFLSAQMSIPYAVAAAWLAGQVGLEEFGEEFRGRADVRALAEKVAVRASDEADAAYPRERPATLTVRTKDGAVETLRIGQPYGEPDNPVSDGALEDKFRLLTSAVLDEQQVDEALAAIRRLDLSFLAALGS